MGDILKKLMRCCGLGNKSEGEEPKGKSSEQTEKSASERKLERIHQYRKQPFTSNGSFIMEYQTEKMTGDLKETDPINVLNYFNAIKWLFERHFWITAQNDTNCNLFNRDKDHIYFNGPFTGIVLYKIPWSGTPVELTVHVEQWFHFTDHEFHHSDFTTEWKAYTYLTYLFSGASKRDDLKGSPLQNNDIYKMFLGTDKWGRAVTLSKIESTWHDTPEQAIEYIFGKLDEIVPKIDQLASYQKDFENAMEKKTNALNEIGIRSLDESDSERGWREERQ